MASHAREHLAGHTRNPTTHPLYGTTLLVQRLERHGGIGRNLKHSRAIGLNRHLAQITLYIPSALDTLCDMIRLGCNVGIFVSKYSQLLDRTHGHSGQALALINILNKYRSLLLLGFDTIGDHGRSLTFIDDNGVDQTLTLKLCHESHIIIDIDQIYTPQRLGRQLCRHEEILIAHGVGLHKLGPYAVHQLILDDGHDLTLREGHLLNHTLGLLATHRGIEQNQTTRTCHTVVTRDDSNEGIISAGQGLHVEDRVGEPAATTIQRFGLRAVGVGVHHKA